MAVGTIDTSILTDIANAIRYQAGVATTYKPREMASAVAALDGTNAGSYQAQPYMALESGILSESVFEDIADAIRGQNGLSTLYQPGDMAAAILALEWDVGLKPRAVLTSLGTLEFNYVDGRHCYSGGVPVNAWEIDPAGYSSASARPYDDIKLQVQKVVIHSSWTQVGMTNASYLFNAFQSMTEVSGFENMSGITSAAQMFSSCPALETIYATSFSNSGLSGSLMFYGCNRLVGGTDGFVPSSTSGASVCKLGAGGVLTDPNNDLRHWFYAYYYEDGEGVLTASATPESGRTLRASGRICAEAKYVGLGFTPWDGVTGPTHRQYLTSLTFAADMAGYFVVPCGEDFRKITQEQLRQMVEDGIAILKVGPALTFSLREGLFALSMMEKQLVPEEKQAHFIEVLEETMVQNPSNWQKHYHGTEEELRIKRAFSFSDRCRYYFARPEITGAIDKLFCNLREVKIPLSMLRQYMPQQYLKVRDGVLRMDPKDLAEDCVVHLAEDYNYATKLNYLVGDVFYR